MQELEDVLKHIKKGKSRDPEGISRDIFHPSVIGELEAINTDYVQPNETTNIDSKFYEKGNNIPYS